MYYVYYLQSKQKKNQFYVGYTTDLKSRLEKHNNGVVSSTKPYLPWKIVFYEAFINKADAKRREKYLKTTKGRKALKLMLREFLSSIYY
ncbi:MAG: GIY-YIG nuclease family protein [Candidatus Moranbacteria bacterium]|nr:GIY-YIG nuclease family protein [Candidatus Moranbacteria bacterium]